MQLLTTLFLFLTLETAIVIGTEVVPLADCSQYQQAISVSGVFFSFTSLLDHGVGPNGYLRVRVVYEGLNWLGFGISRNGEMVPGQAVIGLPSLPNGQTNPGKYMLNGMAVQFVNLMGLNHQTLKNASIIQNATHTTLSFTKRMLENGEYEIHGNSSNDFMYAVGVSNTLAQHSFSGLLPVNLRACVQGAPVVMTPAPSTAAPSPVADLNLPYTFPPTATPSNLPPGASPSPTNMFTSAPTLDFFNITTLFPSSSPTQLPSISKVMTVNTSSPSRSPSELPSGLPTQLPSFSKVMTVNTSSPSRSPTELPSGSPTQLPSFSKVMTVNTSNSNAVGTNTGNAIGLSSNSTSSSFSLSTKRHFAAQWIPGGTTTMYLLACGFICMT